MYLAHFGLHELPFGITPDTQYVCSTRAHQEAMNTLLLTLQSGEGFVKITGEVGVGKTLLCRRFLHTLGSSFIGAYVPNPQMDAKALLNLVAEELEVGEGQGEAAHVIRRINQRLLQLAGEDRSVVLCIDEAQTMPMLTLESLRLLSNLETEKRKLIHIVLFGQPELDEMLAQPRVRQLRQRIAFSYRMPNLARDELDSYLAHRLDVAGHRGEPLFTPRARQALHQGSGGAPRLVNILAHKALLAAFGQGRYRVTTKHVRQAVADTDGASAISWWLPA
ncbi:ExeA family protein [Denitratisoma oestradiolicum]|uniref:AAA family ATPase n=1 Tax=Denitratisoma oestradiolicum TaxID=311182 RepID=A0A6S6XXM5_9PROT|nr:AAA family ATPase [Denitratisoma oestradiolicum]TWO80538.1 AAA family ATPase [Denitratisoma oestradiolicum]CAB1367609.1 AAA family ATPase [Denitratisoma oestradiolicum]